MRLKMMIATLLVITVPMSISASQKHGSNKNGIPVTDPMFGLVFDPAHVKYEPMPSEVRQLCPDFPEGTYWTFAHVRRGNAEYFVVLGITPGQDGDSFGTAVSISGSQCKEEDSKWMLSGFVPAEGYKENAEQVNLPGLGAQRICDAGPFGDCHYVLRSAGEEDLLRGLVKDAVLQGIRAWGGEEAFRKAVCRSQIMNANASMPIVQQEVSEFCKQ